MHLQLLVVKVRRSQLGDYVLNSRAARCSVLQIRTALEEETDITSEVTEDVKVRSRVVRSRKPWIKTNAASFGGGLSVRFPRTRRIAPPKMFRDYGGGMGSDADSIVKDTTEQITREEKLARERANMEGLAAGRHYAEDLQRSSEEGLPARLTSDDLAYVADRQPTRLWVKEKFEAIEADAGARLTEHANALSERLGVIEIDLSRWTADVQATELTHQEAQGVLHAQDSRSYETQEQEAKFAAWRAELEFDDLRYFIHYSTREQARIQERHESIERFRSLLPDRIREVKEEVETSFDAAIESGYRERRAELIALEATKVDGQFVIPATLWQKLRRWLRRLLVVIGVAALIGVATWLIVSETSKATVPQLTGSRVALAIAKARNLGLDVTVVGATFDDASSRVCAQVPLAGRRSADVELIVGRECPRDAANGGSNVR